MRFSLRWSTLLMALVLPAACGDSDAPTPDGGENSDLGDGDHGNGQQHRDAATDMHPSNMDAASPGDDASTTTPGTDAGGNPPNPTVVDETDRSKFGLGGASRCAGSNLLLCDSFEGSAIDTATWTLNTWGSGSATLDATRAARGGKSLHITQPSTTARVVLRETKTFKITGNHFFGRMFLYFDHIPDPLNCHAECDGCTNWVCDNLIHWTVATAGGTFTPSGGGSTQNLGVRAIGAVNQTMMLNIDYGSGQEVGLDDNKNQPAGYTAMNASHKDQWMCFEFEYVGQGEDAEIRVWWDGREHPALHYSKNNRGGKGELWRIPKYEYLEFGLEHYQDYSKVRPSMDAWLDEIAVDDERIGCAR